MRADTHRSKTDLHVRHDLPFEPDHGDNHELDHPEHKQYLNTGDNKINKKFFIHLANACLDTLHSLAAAFQDTRRFHDNLYLLFANITHKSDSPIWFMMGGCPGGHHPLDSNQLHFLTAANQYTTTFFGNNDFLPADLTKVCTLSRRILTGTHS